MALCLGNLNTLAVFAISPQPRAAELGLDTIVHGCALAQLLGNQDQEDDEDEEEEEEEEDYNRYVLALCCAVALIDGYTLVCSTDLCCRIRDCRSIVSVDFKVRHPCSRASPPTLTCDCRPLDSCRLPCTVCTWINN